MSGNLTLRTYIRKNCHFPPRCWVLKGYGAQLAASVARQDGEGEGGRAAGKENAEGGRGYFCPKSVREPSFLPAGIIAFIYF